MNLSKSILALAALFLASCASQQSLQEYYVDNSENPDFLSVSIPASVLNINESELSDRQKEALASLRKFNVLAFRLNEENQPNYELERKKVKEILGDGKYQELMKLNTTEGRGVLKYIGDTDAIDELILFGDSKDKGFILVRIMGKDMNPAHAQFLMEALQKSDFKGEGLEQIGEFFKES